MTDNTYSPKQALARDVLTIAVNGGINHWARVHGYRTDCPPDQVRAEGIDTRAGRSLWQLDLDDLQPVIDILINHPTAYAHDGSGIDPAILRAAGRALSGALAIDRGEVPLTTAQLTPQIADLVVQIALAGQVIY